MDVGFFVVIGTFAAFTIAGLWRSTRPERPSAIPATMPTTPLGLERYCAEALRDLGWRAELTAASGDQGVDVLARKGRVSLVVQCKFYGKPVGNEAVQQALAGRMFTGATHAAVVSNQSYTRSAQDLAQRTGVLLLAPEDLRRADALFR